MSLPSWKDVIDQEIERAEDALKAYKINRDTKWLKVARKALRAAIAIEERPQ